MDQDNIKLNLLEAAWEAASRAYAPYSQFQVGAALAFGDQIVSGCNVENASYGLTICAERTAITRARVGHGLKAGQLDWVLVAVRSPKPTFPCGACRQVLYEFGHANTKVLLSIEPGQICREALLTELLPHAFGPGDLGVSSDG